MVQLLGKTVWWFLKKLNTEVPYDPAIPLLGRDPRELKAGFGIHCVSMLIVLLFTIDKK